MATGTPPATFRLPRDLWVVAFVLCLSLVYMALQVGYVQPYLWPAGHGAVINADSRFAGGSGDRIRLLARPPELMDAQMAASSIRLVVPGSPADAAGLVPGEAIRHLRHPGTRAELDLAVLDTADPASQLRLWRQAYWVGLRGPVELTVRPAGNGAVRTLTLDRPSAFATPAPVFGLWAQRSVGMIAQICVFVLGALIMLFLRSSGATAALGALALALCGVAAGGALVGSEQVLPPGPRGLMTLFAWMSAPIAFPITGLAILYFPERAALIDRHRWLLAVPWIAAVPMLAMGLATGLFLAGADSLLPLAVWDATHPQVYYGSFALALAFNVWTIVEGIGRYRQNPDPNERRRIWIVVLTGVPGVFAYALKEGIPAVALLLTGRELQMPWQLRLFLHALVLLPAFGLTYAVAVNRVLAPRTVIRRSIQYALARNTLTALAVLPGVALAILLVSQRDMTLGMIFSGAPLFYVAMIAVSVAALKYRDRARTWLDQQFFRQEYDARKILLSLASRVRYETDPSDLASLVVSEIDQALHPESTAILVGGIDEGFLTPVTVLHGSAESLPSEGGLVTMLRWSDQPLELYPDDPRSPASRLPQVEREWLECTGAVLLVPVTGGDRVPSPAGTPGGRAPGTSARESSGASGTLIALIALGQKRSEEPYTAEDRQLLASIAGQMSLGLDVARLRRRVTNESAAQASQPTFAGDVTAAPLMECPRCGRCEDTNATVCPTDGSRLSCVYSMPRTVDNKYRVDQLLGRGGMGAVYRARDVRLDRDVALKVVRADLLGNPDARKRFRREAQIVAKLQHPAIVAVYDYGTLPDGGAYLVMEYVKGEDLRRTLEREHHLQPERACRLMQAVCSAMDAAHREGILHRDLKPENILMPEGDFLVKVLDFGVAKLVSADIQQAQSLQTASMLTLGGSIVGTPAYMAPEQLKGQDIDARADIFSLGVITYELLTGTLPFGPGPLADIAVRHYTGAASITTIDPTLPEHLNRAVELALKPDPRARPASPSEFATLLAASLN